MENDRYIKARPATRVADFILDHQPDLVISFGHKLPEEAKDLVYSLAPLNAGIDNTKPVHCFLSSNAESQGGNIDQAQHPYLEAIAADEKLEAVLGRRPDILVHCEYGQARSPRMVLALMGGRLLRDNQQLSVFDAIARTKNAAVTDDLLWRNGIALDDAVEVVKNFELFLMKPLKIYRERLQASAKPVSERPGLIQPAKQFAPLRQ